MENVPSYINITFEITTFITVYIFYKATQKSQVTLTVLFIWMVLQAMLGIAGFYAVTTTTPPRFPLLALPAIIFILALFLMPSGRKFLDTLDTKSLTILHIVRIPVEVVLYWLFLHNAVPELMTFTGRNFDILAGLSAPIIYYFGYVKKQMSRKALLFWNIISLGLLFNIVIHAILSVPSPFQSLAFDQPNIAVINFPFNWLPSVIVPLVLLSHFATIRQLLKK
jgi:hypothetical protein